MSSQVEALYNHQRSFFQILMCAAGSLAILGSIPFFYTVVRGADVMLTTISKREFAHAADMVYSSAGVGIPLLLIAALVFGLAYAVEK